MSTLLFLTLLAHGLADPRVVVVVPSAGALEIRVNELEQPGEPSVETRRRFDLDRDGSLSEAERAKLGEFLVRRATWNLKVTQDGKPLPLETAATALRGASSIGTPDAVSVDVVLRAAPAAKKRRVAVEIADHRPDGHPVRVAVTTDGVTLRRTSLGAITDEGKTATGIELTKGAALRLEWDVSEAPGMRR